MVTYSTKQQNFIEYTQNYYKLAKERKIVLFHKVQVECVKKESES